MKIAALLLMVVSLTACDDAPQQQAASPAPPSKPQAEVIERRADAMGGSVFRYRLKVKVGEDNYTLTCTEDENNITKRDCNWGWNGSSKLSSIDWDVRDCEWEVYDPTTGKSENPKCVYIGLTVWEVTTNQPSSASAQPTTVKAPKKIPEEGGLGNDAGNAKAIASENEGTFTGGKTWTSLTTANDWNIRQDGDYLYIERVNIPPELKAEGAFIRDELRKGPDGKWRGKGRSVLPCEYQGAFKYCRQEIDFEIDLLSEKRIEGIAMEDDVEKFDCGKCAARGVKPIPFTWIPK
jgi:hypothetical protein